MAIPLRSALQMLASPRARQMNDASTLEQLIVDGAALDWPSGLEMQWLGTAGFRFSYEGYTLLVDPYLSRRGSVEVFGRRRLHVDDEMLVRHVPRADAVLVGHTHFDHALDIPALCRRHGCGVYGSRSLAQLMKLHGLAERATVVRTGRVYELGPFRATFVPSLHSKLVLGLRVPYEGELTCEHLDGLHAGAFKCGEVYGIHIEVAGRTFYHQGSANLIDDAVIHRGIDYFLCGIAGRGFTRDYLPRILGALEPRVVIPQHFDDFFRHLEAPMGFSLNVNLGGFAEEVQSVSHDFQLAALRPLQTLRARAGSRA